MYSFLFSEGSGLTPTTVTFSRWTPSAIYWSACTALIQSLNRKYNVLNRDIAFQHELPPCSKYPEFSDTLSMSGVKKNLSLRFKPGQTQAGLYGSRRWQVFS